MRYLFTADYHLGHANIIKYCNRPFDSLEKMHKTIIRNHNSRVKKHDTVFHIGDFCFKNSNESKGEGSRSTAEDWIDQLNGHIVFIKGNHDRNNSLNTIITYLAIEFHKKRVLCVHNPIHANTQFDINLVGHVHEKWKIKRKNGSVLYNVGVDVNKFMPVTFEEILKEINKESFSSRIVKLES